VAGGSWASDLSFGEEVVVVYVRDPRRVRVVGPLAEYAPGFCVELERRGFAPTSASRQLLLMASASRWLAQRRFGVDQFTSARVGMFMAARRRAGYQRRSVAGLMVYLRSIGAAPEPACVVEISPVDALVERYRRYLVSERNLAPLTVGQYVQAARVFIESVSSSGELDASRFTTAEVTGFVLAESRGRSAGTARNVMVRLRSVLRFLYLEGIAGADLTGAVPGVAPQARPLPRSLDRATVARLLDSCDRTSRTGCRDYAILLVLARLGLRAGEVVAIELDDLDWRAGELLVRGKGDRWERLPLPVDVGDALAGYVQFARPVTTERRVFISVRAPLVPLSRSAVNGVVKAACRRCQLPLVGPHAFRHTVAVELLRAGGSLAEIGELLRQRSEFTTAIYAKVDRSALRELARVWPGGES
jgi:site-specific recombinase XerD